MARDQFITSTDLDMENIDINLSLEEARNQLEQEYIVDALIHTKGNVTYAATMLGITRQALYDLLKKRNIDAGKYRS